MAHYVEVALGTAAWFALFYWSIAMTFPSRRDDSEIDSDEMSETWRARDAARRQR